MTFRNSKIWMLVPLSLLATACNLYEELPNFEKVYKTPIELTIGGADGSVASRAVVTDGTNKTLQPFDVATKVFMIMKSEYEDATGDFKGDHTTKYTVSRGDVAAASAGVTGHDITFDDKNRKYWDDAHARSSKLSIWAYAQKGAGWTTCTFNGEERNTTTTFYPWRQDEIVPVINTWKASHYNSNAQDANSVMYQDLLFSNNLVDNTGKGKADGRLKFDFTTRKFPQGDDSKLIFYHAMAKFTINIVMGDGYTADEFKFTPATSNVSLNGFNDRGTFDFRVGEFTATTIGTIPSISQVGSFADNKYTLEALVVPGTNLYSSAVADAFVFTLNNNMYKVSAKTLADAIRSWTDPETSTTPNSDFTTIEAGKNYIFTFNVGKKKIEHLTAAVADWEVVSATELIPTNARIKLNLEERDGTLSDDAVVDIYRAARDAGSIKDDFTDYEWKTGYSGNNNTFRKNVVAWELSNNWFWPDNKTYYHFRALMPTNQTVTTDGSNGDYVSLTSGLIDASNDVIWGAPMLDVAQNETHDSFKWIYKPDKGFDVNNSSLESGNHQIYHAIGPTEDAIKLVLFHMMSQVKFTITTNDGDNAAVILGDGSTDANKTKVELVDYYNNGRLRLGNGKVETTDSPTTNELGKIWKVTSGDPKDFCKYAVIPQDLSGVKLRITTPDHNQYIVDLANITVTTQPVTNNLANPYTASDDKYKIDRWYPGFRYEYTLNLTKKGVTDVTATIVDWETVTAGNDNVQIR